MNIAFNHHKLRIAFLLFITFYTGQSFASDDVLHLSFEKALPDSEVINFINKHSNIAIPTAFFLWVEGHNYSHRIYDSSEKSLTSKDLIESVRAELASTETREKDKNYAIDSTFKILDNNTKSDFVSSETLQNQARFLVGVVNQKEHAYKYLKSGQPVIYGLEYLAKTDQLISIRNDEKVKIGHIKTEDLEFGKKLRQGQQPKLGEKQSYDGIKPEIYQTYAHSKYFIPLSSEELWTMIMRIKKSGKVDQDAY